MAKLATGRRDEARDVFRQFIRRSAREITDLRTRLLYSYIADTTNAQVVALQR
jgi:hypothetical protein